MIRRRFLQFAALTGAGALAPLEAVAKRIAPAANDAAKTAVFQVRGFSCPTCAVGLDTLFSRTKGVISSHSTYPEGKVTVGFDPGAIDLAQVRAVITDAGFTIAGENLS